VADGRAKRTFPGPNIAIIVVPAIARIARYMHSCTRRRHARTRRERGVEGGVRRRRVAEQTVLPTTYRLCTDGLASWKYSILV